MKCKNIWLAILPFYLVSCASPEMSNTATRSGSLSATGEADTATYVVNHLMLRNCKESGQYGLYSYYLVANPASNDNSDFLENIKLFIQKSRRSAYQNRKADVRYMNNTYIPIWIDPPDWVSEVNIDNELQLDTAARWMALNYDYQCAKRILSKIPDLNNSNHYLVSSLSKLAEVKGEEMPDMMVQCICKENREANFPMITEYYKKTWHQRYWDRRSISQVARLLKLSLTASGVSEEDLGVPISDFLAGTEADATLDEEFAQTANVAQAELTTSNPIILILKD